MLTSILLYLFFGALAGFLAGLLGGGGGIIVVPILIYALPLQGITKHVHHLALGTSMATIIFTTLSSVRAHHRHGTVRWDIVARFSPGIIMGTFVGGVIATRIPTRPLTAIFVAFVFYVAYSMFRDKKPEPSRHLPGTAGLLGIGGVIGFVSSFVGIGGGIMTVPFLVMCNVSMRAAVGTSAGVTLPIAVGGTIAYIANGWAVAGLPPHSLGFVYLPALAGVAVASMLAAPLGAGLGYKLSVGRVRKVFACFLIIVACNMLYKLFG